MTFVLLIKIGFTVSGGYSILFNDHKIDLMACDSDSLSLLFETISIFAVVFFSVSIKKNTFSIQKKKRKHLRDFDTACWNFVELCQIRIRCLKIHNDAMTTTTTTVIHHPRIVMRLHSRYEISVFFLLSIAITLQPI